MPDESDSPATLYARIPRDDGRAFRTFFSTTCLQSAGLANPNAPALLQAKENLVEQIVTDIDPDCSAWRSWDADTRQAALLALKTLSRVTAGSGGIYSEPCVTVLMRHGGLLSREVASGTATDDVDTPVSREALKCLSNCLLQQGASLEAFEKNEGVVALLRRLKKTDSGAYTTDCIFLYVRLLFLCTVNRKQAVTDVIDKYGGIEILSNCLRDNLNAVLRPKDDAASEITLDGTTFSTTNVVSEVLKIVFSLQHHYQPTADEDRAKLESFLPSAIRILKEYPLPRPLPLCPPISHAVHSLLNYPIQPLRDIWFPNGDCELAIRLVTILKQSLEYLIPVTGKTDGSVTDPDEIGKPDTDDVLPPLVIVMSNIANDSEEACDVLKKACLPGASERALPVDKGIALSAQLIRLLTAVRFSKLKDTVGSLLYSVCDKDASKFVEAVGYGNAAGFLVMNNIPLPNPQSNGTEGSSSRPFDAITGQYLDSAARANAELAAMTDEEKEREAERLFVLFERLNQTGVITAKNPVGEAIREGRI